MPSLSNKAEPAMATDAQEFSKTVVVMMEKKIRNLEKRKVVQAEFLHSYYQLYYYYYYLCIYYYVL